MKKLALLLVVVLFSTFTMPVYAQGQEMPQYNNETEYQGAFETDRVYLYNKADGIWQTFKSMDQFKCYEARTALKLHGTWVGNISDAGECLGNAEAPEWTSGNFLNFQYENK